MYSYGIDIGYSAVKTVLMDDNFKVVKYSYDMHHGRVFECLKKQIEDTKSEYDTSLIQYAAITGSGGKHLANRCFAEYVNEVTAIVEGCCKAFRNVKSIVEIGGESAKYITNFSFSDKTKIEISMNSNCSSGTGSFLEEQANRLKIDLNDYSAFASKAKSIPRIAGRCSVFAKTDIIHHQQEGVGIEDILQGLSYSLVRNYNSSVIKRLPLNEPIMFIGGVAKNQSIVKALKDVLNLNEENLILSEYSSCMGAFGCAVLSLENEYGIDIEKFTDGLNYILENDEEIPGGSDYEKLDKFGNYDYLGKHECLKIESGDSNTNCHLGVDIGSTSTNVVIMDEDKNILDFMYLKTNGRPKEVLLDALCEFGKKYAERINVVGVGITGSGRYMLGNLIGADLIVDEITAQARAAVEIDPEVDTVFEIGGQDSKYIKIDEGVVTDFQMNKICAAGTGSFIEEQSLKFGIPIEYFGNMALESDNPINLGERCTVFIESSIASRLAKGSKVCDVASGLCYSIVRNYLDRVVGNRRIGNRVLLQGGIAYNQGVINAFRSLTGRKISVPDYFSITGAYGAAILSKEEMKNKSGTDFRGFFLEKERQVKKITEQITENEVNKFTQNAEEILFKDYTENIDTLRKTVGIPRSLFTYGMFSMFHTFFKELGFNVILSDASNEKIIEAAQRYSLDETCYPVKLINGHMDNLISKKVDYIFFPDLFSVDHPGSESRQNYGCAYMQLAFKMVDKSMKLAEKGIELLSPTIAFSFGKEFMSESFMKMGKKLGKNDEEIKNALQAGMKELLSFEHRLEKEAAEVMKNIENYEKVFVVISKIYGAVDPVLNMGIPDKLEKMGYKVIPFYSLPEADINDKYPNLFWPFAQHILEPVETIKSHSNMYAILLTHHGCGPDSIVSHYFRKEMGNKPFLHIEVDEHSSKVGIITRVEAFVNSLESVDTKNRNLELDVNKFGCRYIPNNTNQIGYENMKFIREKIFVPDLRPYSEILRSVFAKKGVEIELLGDIDMESVETGRRHMISEECFSATALLGNVLKKAEKIKNELYDALYLIPQNEGSEVDGQFSKFIGTKIEDCGYLNSGVLSPFAEDIIYSEDSGLVSDLQNVLVAGDMVRLTPLKYRQEILADIIESVSEDVFGMSEIERIGKKIHSMLCSETFAKTVLAIGDPLLLFSDFMNNGILKKLEIEGNRVVYTPLSEYLWMMWKDHADFNAKTNDENYRRHLSELENKMSLLSRVMGDKTSFTADFFELTRIANKLIGYYSGMNGRYRYAKSHSDSVHVDGVITMASMYENTGIMLNILKKDDERKTPVLNLTFDGNENDNDRIKIDSFMYYI